MASWPWVHSLEVLVKQWKDFGFPLSEKGSYHRIFSREVDLHFIYLFIYAAQINIYFSSYKFLFIYLFAEIRLANV